MSDAFDQARLEGGRHGGWPHANGVAGAVWYGDAGDSARPAVERRSRE